MKAFKKLIPAMAMLLISVVAMSSASFAWFSMNKTVTASGMTVTTTVSSNLLISSTTTEADFIGQPLTQEREGKLEPVSTVDGEHFFYTLNAKADGDAASNNYIAYSEAAEADSSNVLDNIGAAKTHYDKAFNTAYGVTSVDTSNVAYGYIDYTFYLKAITTEANQSLKMDKCNLLYDEAAITAESAMRVAVFATAASERASDASSASTSLITILTLDGATNQESNKAVSSTTALGEVTYNSDAVICDDIDGTANTGVTKYFKVVVRLYLEGEDTTCTNSTFLTLTDSWKLDVGFSLDTATPTVTAVNNISSDAS